MFSRLSATIPPVQPAPISWQTTTVKPVNSNSVKPVVTSKDGLTVFTFDLHEAADVLGEFNAYKVDFYDTYFEISPVTTSHLGEFAHLNKLRYNLDPNIQMSTERSKVEYNPTQKELSVKLKLVGYKPVPTKTVTVNTIKTEG